MYTSRIGIRELEKMPFQNREALSNSELAHAAKGGIQGGILGTMHMVERH